MGYKLNSVLLYNLVFIIIVNSTLSDYYKFSGSSEFEANFSEFDYYNNHKSSIVPVVQHDKAEKENSKRNQLPFHDDDESLKIDNNICMEEVKTLNGYVRGKFLRNSLGDKLCIFYGIPFGKPPLGDLRFKRPLPVTNWEGILEATKLPNACIQPISPHYPTGPMWDANTLISEDCLYLNIWIPLSIFKNRANNLKQASPAMIWIYGGGFLSGSSSLDVFNGAILAGRQNIIVGSMQYRVGLLGFLYFGREDAPGNMAMLDQVLALQWFYDNLKQFGGNPGKITLFGESAGANSVSLHLLSYLSRPLFKRAIIMSGVSIAPSLYRSPKDALEFSYDFAKSVGCYSMNNISNLNQIMACLRNIDPMNTLTFDPNKKFLDVPAGVTVDGYFLLDTPKKLLNDENLKDADIIIGNVMGEIEFFLLTFLPNYYQINKTPIFSYNKFLDIINIMFRDLPQFEIDAIISHYTNWKYLEDGNENRERIITAGTGRNFICPSLRFANKWAAKGSNVYFYLFDQKSPDTGRGRAPWASNLHGDDIEYIFGRPLTNSSRSIKDKILSRQIQKLFTRFAKVGVPSKNWKPYTQKHPVFIRLNSTITSDKTTSNIFGPNAVDCQFWNYDLPKLGQYYYKTCG